MSTETPSLPQNCSDSCLARDERNLHYRNWSNVRACIKRKMCYTSVVMAHWPGPALAKTPWPIWVSSVCVKISWPIAYLTTYFSSWISLLKLGIFLSTSVQRLCPHYLKGQAEYVPICPTCSKQTYWKVKSWWLTNCLLCPLLYISYFLDSFVQIWLQAPSTKKVWKCTWKNTCLLSQHHAYCCQFLWLDWTTAQSSKKWRPNPQSCYFYIS